MNSWMDDEQRRRMYEDLGVGMPFIKGEAVPVRNCWHFSTDGTGIDVMFYDEKDFVGGMNRIYVVLKNYRVIVLAFCLMDNHVHFVLHGGYEECNKFVHEYVRRTSMSISIRHGDEKKLADLPIHHQAVTDDQYLKTVICYVVKNPYAAGLPILAMDYPWSSGALYFRIAEMWTSPSWIVIGLQSLLSHEYTSGRKRQKYLASHEEMGDGCVLVNGLIFPGEYVEYEVVQRIFRTHKGYSYYLFKTKDEDIESKGEAISRLSIPDSELRQRKREICMRMYGTCSVKNLNTFQRMSLAKALRNNYTCSVKQVARVTGLVAKEIEHLL